MTRRWEHFPHEADIGVRGVGPTLAAAFEEAARALAAIVTDPADVAETVAVEIRCRAPDRELLLVDWLNAVIFEMTTRHLVFARFVVSIEGNALAATAHGGPLDRARHAPAVEPKGATMTALAVRRGGDGIWIAETVIDV